MITKNQMIIQLQETRRLLDRASHIMYGLREEEENRISRSEQRRLDTIISDIDIWLRYNREVTLDD
jgi:hypothetical protein